MLAIGPGRRAVDRVVGADLPRRGCCSSGAEEETPVGVAPACLSAPRTPARKPSPSPDAELSPMSCDITPKLSDPVFSIECMSEALIVEVDWVPPDGPLFADED